MKQQPTFIHVNLKQNTQPGEAIERLEALFGQHAIVTEHLRQLSFEETKKDKSDFKQTKWNSLENEVVRLRVEMENFKQVFDPLI